MIQFRCACGKTLSAKEELAGKKARCPACKASVDIPAGLAEVPIADPALSDAGAPARTCPSCHSDMDDLFTTCPACGWAEKQQKHGCAKCGGPLSLDYGSGFGAAAGAAGGIAAFVCFFLFGILGGIAILCGLAAIGGIIGGLTIRYECGMCGELASGGGLPRDERRKLSRTRTALLSGSAALGVVCTLCVLAWVSVVKNQYRKMEDQARIQQQPFLNAMEEIAREAEQARNAPSEGAPAPTTESRIQVDNGSEHEWRVLVNGEEKGRVPPLDFLEFTLPLGEHEFRILQGSTEIERVTYKVAAKVTLYNPGGKNVYVKESARYGYGEEEGAVVGGEELIRGERFLHVHFGLGEPLPSVVYAPIGGTSTSRSKVCRVPPDSLTPAAAAALLTARDHVWRILKPDLERAVATLERAAGSEALDALLRCMESDRKEVIEAVSKAVEAKASMVPAERLVAWLSKPCRVGHLRLQERVLCATRILVRSDRGDALREQFGKCPLANQCWIASGLKEAPADLKKAALFDLLKRGPPKEDEETDIPVSTTLQSLFETDDLRLDDDLARSMDEYVSAWETDRKQGGFPWWTDRLCARAADFGADYIVPRLLAEGKSRKNEQEAIAALLNSPHAGRLMEAIRNEEDADRKKQREEILRRTVARLGKDAPAEIPLKVVEFAGSKELMHEALRVLFIDGERREEGLRLLAERYSAIASVQNRIWLLSSLFDTLAHPGNHLEPLKELLLRGLDDGDASVRLSAAMAGLRPEILPGPETAKVWKILQEDASPERTKRFSDWFAQSVQRLEVSKPESVKLLKTNVKKALETVRDAELRKDLETVLRKRLLYCAGNMDTRLDGAVDALLDLADDPEDEVALAAVDRLPFPREGKADFLPELTELYGKTKSEERKKRILSNARPCGDERCVALFLKALNEKTPEMRRYAFDSLHYRYNGTKDKKLVAHMEKAAAKEKDPKLKDDMTRVVQSLKN